MAHIVIENCIRCKMTDCAAVCPVDCFHEGENMLVIDPAECIDCGACIPECPVNAIYLDQDLPPGQEEYIALNAELSPGWPVINKKGDPLPDWEQWKDVKGKITQLSRKPALR